MRSIGIGVGLVALIAQMALAQPRAAPKAGDWVRLSTRALDAQPDWMVGSLAVVTNRFVVIEPIGAGPLAIPHGSLTRVELRTGWRHHARRGSVLGILAGSAVSLGLLLSTSCEPACLAGPAVGAGVGMVMGRGRSSLHWEAMEPGQLKLHHIASAPAVRLLSVAF